MIACIAVPAVAQHAQIIRRLDGTHISPGQAESIASAELKADKVTGAQIAILNRGHMVWTYAFGLRDVARNLPMTPDTNTWAASITKAVFATWVMQLVEQHQLDLDQPVAQMLPPPLNEFERYRTTASELVNDPRWARVTPRMLLSHTAGFANFSALEPDGKILIHFTPGTRFAYSGEGLNLLQFVLEQKMQMPIEQGMENDIFKPLEMNETGMVWKPSFDKNAAFRYDATGKLIARTYRTKAKAAGSMTTSAHDLSLFLEALLAKKIVNSSTERQMFTPQIKIHSTYQFPTFDPSTGNDGEPVGLAYGLGWGLLTRTRYGPAFFKEGHGDGAENYLICFPRSGSCMVLLTNSDNGELSFQPLLEGLLGDSVTPWKWEGYTRDMVLHNQEHTK